MVVSKWHVLAVPKWQCYPSHDTPLSDGIPLHQRQEPAGGRGQGPHSHSGEDPCHVTSRHVTSRDDLQAKFVGDGREAAAGARWQVPVSISSAGGQEVTKVGGQGASSVPRRVGFNEY